MTSTDVPVHHGHGSVMDDSSLISETDSGIEVNISNGAGTVAGTGIVYVRFSVPDLEVENCLQLNMDDSAWIAKQHILSSLSQELPESFNYGLYCPPANGRAGKFLDEERPLRDYPFAGPVGFVQLKYKQRLYRDVVSHRQLKHIHSKTNVKTFLDAVRKNDIDKVFKLTGRGFDPNIIDRESGETPLTLAAELPNPKPMMLALLEGGSHLDFRNAYGRTSVHRAAELGNCAALQTLLDLGMSTNYKDVDGLTPLYVSIVNGRGMTSERCVQTLLFDHAVVGLTDRSGWTELHQACKSGRMQIVDQLVYYGADVNSRNNVGNTPLHVCAIYDQEDCARMLMFRGAERHLKNLSGETAFQVAINVGNMQLASIIEGFSESDVVLYRDLPLYNQRRRSYNCRQLPEGVNLYGTVRRSVSRCNSACSGSSDFRPLRRAAGHSVAGQHQQPDGSESPVSSTTTASIWSLPDSDVGSRKDTPVNCLTRHRSVVLRATEPNNEYGFVLQAVDASHGTSDYPSQHQFAVIDDCSPAQFAGLHPGDFLLEINGVNVTSSSPTDVMSLITSSGGVITVSIAGRQTSSAVPPDQGDINSTGTLPMSSHPTSFTGEDIAGRQTADTMARVSSLVSDGHSSSVALSSPYHHHRSALAALYGDVASSSSSNKVASIRSVHGKRMTMSIPAEELFVTTGVDVTTPPPTASPRRDYSSTESGSPLRAGHARSVQCLPITDAIVESASDRGRRLMMDRRVSMSISDSGWYGVDRHPSLPDVSISTTRIVASPSRRGRYLGPEPERSVAADSHIILSDGRLSNERCLADSSVNFLGSNVGGDSAKTFENSRPANDISQSGGSASSPWSNSSYLVTTCPSRPPSADPIHQAEKNRARPTPPLRKPHLPDHIRQQLIASGRIPHSSNGDARSVEQTVIASSVVNSSPNTRSRIAETITRRRRIVSAPSSDDVEQAASGVVDDSRAALGSPVSANPSTSTFGSDTDINRRGAFNSVFDAVDHRDRFTFENIALTGRGEATEVGTLPSSGNRYRSNGNVGRRELTHELAFHFGGPPCDSEIDVQGRRPTRFRFPSQQQQQQHASSFDVRPSARSQPPSDADFSRVSRRCVEDESQKSAVCRSINRGINLKWDAGAVVCVDVATSSANSSVAAPTNCTLNECSTLIIPPPPGFNDDEDDACLI